MKIKQNFIKTNCIVIPLLLLILIVPACELFLPFPESEELKLDKLSLNSPANRSTINLDYYNEVELDWVDISEDKNYEVEYELYISETPSPGLYSSNLSSSYYTLKLEKNKTYYWKVVAKLENKISESETWSFTTE